MITAGKGGEVFVYVYAKKDYMINSKSTSFLVVQVSSVLDNSVQASCVKACSVLAVVIS